MSSGFDYSVAMNFSWVEEGRIAGCRGPRSDNDLAFLKSMGIGALVRLAHDQETSISKTVIESHGLEDCYEPVPDWTPPSQSQIDRVIGFILSAVDRGKFVAVSCGAGCGRTGTVLACYFVTLGYSAENAIRQLIELRPCSREILEVPGQKEAVLEFGHRQDQDTTTGPS